MARILITGAAGSIGIELVLYLLANTSDTVCAFDSSEDGLFNLNQKIKGFKLENKFRIMLGDVRDYNRLLIALNGVDIVYHLAALKHVELTEYNPFEAVKTNVQGVQNIIQASIANNVEKVLLTSSDKSVNPTSSMGASKLLGEKLFISSNNLAGSSNTKLSVLRFGNVWDTNGSVGRIFCQQALARRPLTVTSKEMTRFFVTKSESVQLCIDSVENMIGGEIFVRNMGVASVYEIASYFANLYDLTISIIGPKPGEKLYEELFTDVELPRARILGSTIVIIPDNINQLSCLYTDLMEKYYNLPAPESSMRSDSLLVPTIDIPSYCKSIIDSQMVCKN
ncbi:polysaccharide biosynthesis protein [bacterium]|nr:polysaccharide biosynthesis protein [bacterium]